MNKKSNASFAWTLLASMIALAQAPASSAAPAPDATQAAAAAEPYGPLTFNEPSGADFYVAQEGHFVQAEVVDGTIRIHLKNAPFQIGTNVDQMNIALSLEKEDEISTDSTGFKASRLSGPFQAAREPDSDELLVFTGTQWSDGNNVLELGANKSAEPLAGYKIAYEVGRLAFIGHDELDLSHFKGTIHGYLCVYKDHVRQNSFIMPIELVF